MQKGRNLRIAIDCRIENSQQGVGTAVLALAKAFSDSESIGQEYTFIVRHDMREWLAPYVYGPCRLVAIPASRLSLWKNALRRLAPLRFLWSKLRDGLSYVSSSDGYVESQKFDVVHFPTQTAYLTSLPSIYQPWDLQHLHYPQFFSAAEFAHRERNYRKFCECATFICVQAQWSKRDIVDRYGVTEEKTVVIPWGSVLNAYSLPSIELAQATIKKFDLPGCFFFYPAVTWPHKNHEVILRALSVFKSRFGTCPQVYFTGSSTDFRLSLEELAQDLGVFEQVHYLGFITPGELQIVFDRATAMIFPSKFEGFGLPILEAFHAGLPVVCSNATTLPEVARDAALYFDPDSPDELASLMEAVMNDPALRQTMIEKGARMLLQYSMNDTVSRFQTLYEKTALLPPRSYSPSADRSGTE